MQVKYKSIKLLEETKNNLQDIVLKCLPDNTFAAERALHRHFSPLMNSCNMYPNYIHITSYEKIPILYLELFSHCLYISRLIDKNRYYTFFSFI